MAVLLEWTKKHIVIIRVLDSVSGAEVIDALLTLSGDARFDDIRGLIYDWSGYLFLLDEIDVNDVEKLAEITRAMAKSNSQVKQGVVLMDGTIDHRGAFFSIFEVLTADLPWQTASFETLELALAWVELVNTGTTFK